VAEIISSARESLASYLRAHNRQTVLARYQLPTELFGQVCETLKPDERVSITQVSHDWREAALASPQLWTSISFVSSKHLDNCECTTCVGRLTSGRCSDCKQTYRRRHPDSASRVAAYLARSRGHPIEFDVEISGRSNADPAPVAAVANTLLQHEHRVQRLSAAVDDPLLIQRLLEPFDRLNALRVLKVENDGDFVPFERPTPLELPVLETLELAAGLTCDSEFRLHCPAVTTLTAKFTTGMQVRALLRACPAVKDVTFRIGPNPVSIADDIEDEIHGLLDAAHLRSLRLNEAFRIDCIPCMSLFAHSSIGRFTMDCRRADSIGTSDLDPFFAEISKCAVLLECASDRELEATRLSVFGDADATVRERTLIFHPDTSGEREDEPLHGIWCQLAPSSQRAITEIRISSRCWSGLFDRDLKSVLPVITAHVEITDHDDILSWLGKRNEIESACPEHRWRFLQAVHFVSPNEDDSAVEIDNDFVLALRGAFGLENMLQELTLEGWTLTGDPELLRSRVAVEVQIRSPATQPTINAAD